jgi:hypothetical protein
VLVRLVLTWLCATATTTTTGIANVARGDITLVAAGRSDYVIVVGRAASPAERRGAAEIQSHLEQMSGVTIPITGEDIAVPDHGIFVGHSRFTPELGVTYDSQKLGPEGFVLKAAGPHVVVLGGSPRGTMYGCTALLERLDVRWFTPTVTRVPKRTTVTLARIDEAQSPAFEYREPFFWEAFDKDWAARMRVNGHHARLDDSTGGHVVYGRFVHTFDELVPPKLFETHPEYFPLIGGQRTGGYVQRCLSNPHVLRLSIERVREWIAKNPAATIFSVSQNDTAKWCECEACTSIADQYGGVQSGLYLWFVNQLAEAIEKDHPDKLIDTLAYQFTEAAPTGVAPRASVRVRLCPIACCQAHPYERCAAEPNRAFLKNLAAWSKLTDSLYIWHYNTNFAGYLLPFPDFDEFPAEARLYKRLGVRGIFFQGAYAEGGGGSDSELRAYLMARLLWDVNVDTDALVSEWMSGVYGAAAPPMRRWFDLMHMQVRAADKHLFIYDPPTAHYLSADVLAEGDRLFDQAEKLAAGDAVAEQYVAKARLGLRYAKLMQRPRVDDEFRAFMSDVRRFGITQLREGQPIDAFERQYVEQHGKK